MNPETKIYVAGHRGLVGSAILRRLTAEGYGNIVARTRAELDLRDADATDAFFAAERPEIVFLAAARVGGIVANDTRPAEFIYDNLLIETNVIHSACRHGARRLVFLGSSCIYPRECPQPIQEQSLMTGPLEPTNSAYAVAKIAGIELCRAYRRQYGLDAISLMPTNLYGPNDNYDLETSHVLPALIRRFHEAKVRGLNEVTLWGSGAPRREFLHVDDLADACLFLARQPRERLTYDLFNIGVGKDITIRDLAELIREVIGFTGMIGWDTTKPDGAPRKLLDVSRMRDLGWAARIGLREGLTRTYRDFLREHGETGAAG